MTSPEYANVFLLRFKRGSRHDILYKRFAKKKKNY